MINDKQKAQDHAHLGEMLMNHDIGKIQVISQACFFNSDDGKFEQLLGKILAGN